ncbi:MAG: DoxX family protein [Planctomycetota bacterium]
MAHIGVGVVTAIVLMRLSVGWHFYSEGIKKLEPGFSSAGLLSAAKGPLGPFYRSFVPKPGGYDALLATPRMAGSISDEQALENAEWRKAYADSVKASVKAGETPLAEFPPHSPYSEWAEEVADGWRSKRDRAARLADSEESAEQVYRVRLQQLADYLGDESDSIEEFRHELWRLEQMRESPGATSLDFREERIADKTAETSKTARGWWAAVATLENSYVNDLASLEGIDSKAPAIRQLRTPSWLDWIDPMVMMVVTGVGVCMLLGFCTRLAGVVGAGFLLSVIVTQPPWVVGADTTYLGYQLAEIGAMLTLAAIGAGRWYGLDSVLRRFCSSCCGPKD